MVCANICISGTASPRLWYLQPQTHDRGVDRTERTLQAEEQILERDEEEPKIVAADLQLKLEFHSLYIKRTRAHPYHVQKLQGLELADYSRFVIYCK
ncbi:hypothetical protein Zmor_021695 [Zophobas morio]|uniref:Uncharacterized protein n=1 Tax=Zophobas morio TaxID=2755281 RepID=A0AA38I6A0_9CUCU|nr:hypothetical protein Zmor_021695 [Zophobas morio]